jgi:hypothetical protein
LEITVQQFQLWATDTTYPKIELAEPMLASWNASSDPEQIALQRYLDSIEQKPIPLPQSAGLFLHMEIDVKKREHLLHGHDLDNYLYPVVQRLGVSRFRYVRAIKRVGGGSYLQIGQTKSTNAFPAVELQLVWKCSSKRNWTSLWKPTIDAMGPVLGETAPHRPFHPNDDRIVSLALHFNTDNSIGWSVQIGMLWRSSSGSPL